MESRTEYATIIPLRVAAVATALLLAMAGSCSGDASRNSPAEQALQQSDPVQLEIADALPPLPAGKLPAEWRSSEILGRDIYMSSSNTITALDTLVLPSPATSTAWAIWELPAGDNSLQSVSIELDIDTGDTAWIALSDYSTGTWAIEEPLADNVIYAAYPLDNSTNLSPGNNCYVAVLTTRGNAASVNKLILTVDATGWQIVTIAEDLSSPVDVDLISLDGNPAIAYIDYLGTTNTGALKFVYSSNADGLLASDWSSNYVWSTEQFASLSLAAVNGNPALAFQTSAGTLMYAYSTNAFDVSTKVLLTTEDTSYASLAVIDGNPGICFVDDTTQTLSYIRATTATGENPADWVAAVTVDSDFLAGQYNSLAEVDGHPAISYSHYTDSEHTDLAYVRSTTTTGANASDWTEKVTVDGFGVSGYTSLAIVDGNPAISYFEAGGKDLKYVRSTTGTGNSVLDWNPLVTVHSMGYVGQHNVLAVIDGNPAITYMNDSNGSILYMRSNTTTGQDASAWLQIPQKIAGGENDVWSATALAEISTRPAVCYFQMQSGGYVLMYAVLFE